MPALSSRATQDTHASPVDGSAPPNNAKRWAARLMIGLPLLFLCFDGLMKLIAIPQVVQASAELGFGPDILPVLGSLELLAALLTFVESTSVVGAVMLSAYLGGAIATHLRLGDPLFTHTLFPVYFAALIWGGLYLRDERVRALSPFGTRR